MRKLFLLIALLATGIFGGCSDNNSPETPEENENQLYFPPVNSDEWEKVSPGSLSWNTEHLDELYNYLSDNGTRAFIVLKDGKIVLEEYWGNNIVNTKPFDADTQWYWASAGKTIVAFLIGIAQQENLLNINDKTSDYLGKGWTSLSEEKENLITIRHQLTMTTGLDYNVPDVNCTDASCLKYKKDAGQQWYYHNAPYTLLKDVIHVASGKDMNDFTDEKLEAICGMSGTWIYNGSNNVFWSKARDMARFGLLILNRGKWDAQQILSDENYFEEMTNTSQSLNPSYGYLWWLNGKSSIIFPSSSASVNTELASNAPDDLIAAAGKNGQYVDVIPGKNMVVIRIGEAPDGSLVPIQFHNEMWEKLNLLIED